MPSGDIFDDVTRAPGAFDGGGINTFLGKSGKTFIALKDCPAGYEGSAGKFCKVNSTEETLEFSSVQNIPLADLGVADPHVAGQLWRNGTSLMISLG